jgi:hypothetical protein
MTSRRPLLAAGAVVLAAAVGVGVGLFEPWRLFTTTTVSDALLDPVSSSARDTSAGPSLVAAGEFRSLEHETTGTAQLVRTADGEYVVQFVDLDTSDGPDLHVYLSAALPSAAEAAFGENPVSLGPLKGNRGDQVYPVPTADLSQVRSVVIWCRRFATGFAVAGLTPVDGRVDTVAGTTG